MVITKRFNLLLLAALLIGVLSSPAGAQPKASIRAGEGIGPIRMYQNSAEVVKKVGQPHEVREFASFVCWTYYAPYNGDNTKILIHFTKLPNRELTVYSVAISGSKGIFATPEGVTLGMSVKEAMNRLGDKRQPVQSGTLQYQGSPGIMALDIKNSHVHKITCHTSSSASNSDKKLGAAPKRTSSTPQQPSAKPPKMNRQAQRPNAKPQQSGAKKTSSALQGKAVIRAGKSIGPIGLLQKSEEVIKKVGQPHDVHEYDSFVCWYYYVPHNGEKTQILIHLDRTSNRGLIVSSVAISGAKGIFTTPEGVTLGMPVNEAMTRLGDKRQPVRSGTLQYKGSPGLMALEIRNGRVYRVTCHTSAAADK
ncbi:MAG: hypothetical protein Q4F00_03815 [bacterium]|nr:hypothetical protein [bacterium]